MELAKSTVWVVKGRNKSKPHSDIIGVFAEEEFAKLKIKVLRDKDIDNMMIYGMTSTTFTQLA